MKVTTMSQVHALRFQAKDTKLLQQLSIVFFHLISVGYEDENEMGENNMNVDVDNTRNGGNTRRRLRKINRN